MVNFFKKCGLFLCLLIGATSIQANDKVIKVASHIEPMTDIIKLIQDDLKSEGYTIELILVKDNIMPNVALQNKEIDANFFQHIPYMQEFNKSHNANLVGVQPVYDAFVGFYSKEYKDIKDLPKGAKIAIPNDPPNQARALAILADYDLIKLKDGVGINAMLRDITENPHDFKFLAVDLLNLSRAYNEVAMVFNYPAYISKIGLSPKDAIILEKNDGEFVINLVAREDNKDSDKIQVLKRVITSDKVRTFLIEKDDSIKPSF